MSIKRTVAGLAAVALAVAGVVGVVWAQAPASPVAGGPSTGWAGGGSYVVPVGYENKGGATGTLTVTPKGAWASADTAKFMRYAAITDTVTANAFSIGTVAVKSDGGTSWDVELGTASDGFLVFRTTSTDPASKNDTLKKRATGGTATAPVISYPYARLQLQLGVLKGGNVYAKAPIDTNWIKNSRTAPISFAQAFGAKKTAANDTMGIRDELGGKHFALPAGTSIKDVGFTSPAATTTPANTITFDVRAGMGLTTAVKADSTGAAYTDTVKFTLRSQF